MCPDWRENLLSSIGRLFVSPSSAPSTSSLASFVDEGIARWNELQNEEWLVDATQNRTALGFQFLNGNDDPVSPVQLRDLREAIREASNAANSECPGLTTFDISHRGHIAPTIRVVANAEGFEVTALFNSDGTYLMGPSFWRAMVNGCGVEIRPYHEDTDWVRGAVEQRTSREWQVGGYLSPRFQAVRDLSIHRFRSKSVAAIFRCPSGKTTSGLRWFIGPNNTGRKSRRVL